MLTETIPAQPSEAALPYYLFNIPETEWPKECPNFLRNISERDREMMSIPDEQYRRLPWEEVQEIIRNNHLELFKRLPSDIRKYIAYTTKLKEDYGSVARFVLEKRLQWKDLEPRDADPFNNPDTNDIKILYNDWPYGIDQRIIHLVVWTKFVLEEDPVTEDLTARARKEIDDYVGRKFREGVSSERVIWFKNWKSLKSVHAVEHFHVMLYDPDPIFIKKITNGDLPVDVGALTYRYRTSRTECEFLD